jgi:hypothetical protein
VKTIERKRQAALLAYLRLFIQNLMISFTKFLAGMRSAYLLEVGLDIDLEVNFPFIQISLCTQTPTNNLLIISYITLYKLLI